MSQAFLDRPSVYQPSVNPDQAARETIQLMRSYIKESARDPLVQNEARSAVASYPSPLLAASGISGDDPRLTVAAREQAIAESCWSWAKHNLEFVHHSKLLLLWMGNHDALQLLISPDVIVHAFYGDDAEARQRARKGDCAVFSPMICALLEANALDWELVIGAVDRNQPETFSHVWPRVVLSDGRRVSLDASHGPYPGWQVPARDINRLQVFDSSGRAVQDRGNTFAGLGEYIATNASGLGAFGDDFGFDPYNPSGSTDVGAPSGGWPSSGGSSIDWANILGGSVKSGFDILGRVVAPTTTYTVGPNGQVSYVTPGSAPAPGVIPSIGGSSNLLLLGGLGLGALVLASMFGGRK